MTKRVPQIFVYKAKDGWRWRLKSANGKIICEGGEALSRKPNEDYFRRLQDTLYDADMVSP